MVLAQQLMSAPDSKRRLAMCATELAAIHNAQFAIRDLATISESAADRPRWLETLIVPVGQPTLHPGG